MVQCLKITKEFGSKALRFLRENDYLDTTTKIGKTQRYLLLPIKDGSSTRRILKEFKGTIESRNLSKVQFKGPPNLREALKKVVPNEKAEYLHRGFDIVGDIAILEISPELEKLEKSIAWTVKKIFPNIKVVAKKAGKTSGPYRIRKIKVLQGEKRTDAIHKESGVRIHVDLNKAYFSPRMGSDRIRISNEVGKNEKILVIFAGVGPQALVIAKQNPTAKVWAIEINPDAVELMNENIRINYLGPQIKALEGDVKTIVPTLKQKFERIVMIHPHAGSSYLNLALSVAKKGGKIHMYAFTESDKTNDLKKKIESEYKVRVDKVVKAGEYSPRITRVSVDMTML